MTAIDLGSNTLRIVTMACDTLEPVALFERIVRTADGLAGTGMISQEAVERIVSALREAREEIPLHTPMVAVTTEAIRRASNAEKVLKEIRERTGVHFRVIDGKTEAAYTLLAVRTRLRKLALESERFVLVDIGGGSTEVLFFNAGKTFSESFPLGIVTLAQKYGSLERIAEALEAETMPICAHVAEARAKGFSPHLFVSTAGTPTTVAAMKLGMTYATYDPMRVNGTVVRREDLQVQLRRLLALDEEARQKVVGVGREDLIAAGILIFDKLYEILGFDEAVVIDDGLREGVAIAECRQLSAGEILT